MSVDGVVATQGPATPLVQVLLPKPQASPAASEPEQSTWTPSLQLATVNE
jgi:hypothetical protein